jgi:hypothetical protein
MPFLKMRSKSRCRPVTPNFDGTTSCEQKSTCSCCQPRLVFPKVRCPPTDCPPAEVVVCKIKKCCCKRTKPNPNCRIPNCCCRKPQQQEDYCAEVKTCATRPRSKCRSSSNCKDKLWCKNIGRASISCERTEMCEKPTTNSNCSRVGCSKRKPCMTCCKIGCFERPPLCIVCRRARCICKNS